jgi:hypothetical protein
MHVNKTDGKALCQTLKQAFWAVPWLWRLVAGLSPRRPGFDPRSVHVGFVVDKVELGQVFPRILRFSSVNFIPPVLHYFEKLQKLITFLFITGFRCVRSGALQPTPQKHKLSLFILFIYLSLACQLSCVNE